MDDILVQNADEYAARQQLQLAERLGFGIHGIVFSTKNNQNENNTAVKIHRSVEPYKREREIYQRLLDAKVFKILGFHVPKLLNFDDNLRIIEISIVSRPFVLDFAGAYLDFPPEFPDEVWAEWEAEKQDQFDKRWPKVQAVLGALEELEIHMIDVSPSNIAFLD
jgi:hypothetical protein